MGRQAAMGRVWVVIVVSHFWAWESGIVQSTIIHEETGRQSIHFGSLDEWGRHLPSVCSRLGLCYALTRVDSGAYWSQKILSQERP